MLVSTYFGEIGDALPVLAASPVEAIGLDFVAGPGNREALAALGGIGGQDPGRRGGRRPQRVAHGPAAALSLCESLRGLAGQVVREHVLLAAARAAGPRRGDVTGPGPDRPAGVRTAEGRRGGNAGPGAG